MATKAKATIDAEKPATSTSTAVAALQAKLAKQSEEVSKKIAAPSGDQIRLTKDKRFALPDGSQSEPGATLSVVILDFVAATAFYDQPYQEGTPLPPACFALSAESHKTLVPSDNSPDKQSDDCLSCPNNQFGSKGKGKACGNYYLLAVTTPDDNADSPVWVLKVASTGLRAFDGYVGAVSAQFKMPTVGVVTDIWMDPESEYQSLRFGNAQANPNVAMHDGKREAAMKRLLTEPDVSAYVAPKKFVRPPVTKKPGK